MTDVSLEERIAALESKVEFLQKARPGRRMKPNVVSKTGVCGVDPDRNSETCSDASIYRYQQGCQGTKCVQINRDYYADYRQKRKENTKPTGEAVVEEPAPAETPLPNLTPGMAIPPWDSRANGQTQEEEHAVATE